MRAQKKEKQKENILKAAAAAFSEKGYLNTTISDIALKAGVGKGTIYGYFSSKEDLFFSLFKWYNNKIVQGAGFHDMPDQMTESEKIIFFTRAVMESVMDMIEFYGLSLEFWSATVSTQNRENFKHEFSSIYDTYILSIQSILNSGIEKKEFTSKTDTESTARGIIGVMDALGLQYWLGQSFDPVDASVKCIETILKGIRYKGDQ